MDRPRVVLWGEVSLDGRLTTAPGVLLLYGDKRWSAVAGSSDSYAWMQHTHRPQACLEGSSSLVPEGEEPAALSPVEGDTVALYEDYLPDRIVQRSGHRGWFTMVDSRGRVRWAHKDGAAFGQEWVGWYALVLVARCTPPEYLAYLRREEIPYLVAGADRVDLALALGKMAARLGVSRVVTTSPGKLGGALLRAGLVDEINIEFFPAIIGGTATPALFDGPELQPGEWPTRLKLLSAQVQAGGRVWLRYEVVRE